MNMNNMMKQVQKMQRDMLKAQEELNVMTFEGVAQNLVKVTMNGKKEVTRVELSADILAPEEKEMVEDLVVLAVNDAIRQVEAATESKMGSFTKGMNIPGLF